MDSLKNRFETQPSTGREKYFMKGRHEPAKFLESRQTITSNWTGGLNLQLDKKAWSHTSLKTVDHVANFDRTGPPNSFYCPDLASSILYLFRPFGQCKHFPVNDSTIKAIKSESPSLVYVFTQRLQQQYDVAQGQFSSEVLLVWIQSFLVGALRQKIPDCPINYP